ncbi:hypothetical protein WDZ92_46805 [Nostoc sp. NIES-2111]
MLISVELPTLTLHAQPPGSGASHNFQSFSPRRMFRDQAFGLESLDSLPGGLLVDHMVSGDDKPWLVSLRFRVHDLQLANWHPNEMLNRFFVQLRSTFDGLRE